MPWINVRWCREEAEPVSQTNDIRIFDLAIRPSRHNLEKIAFRSNWGGDEGAKFGAGQSVLPNCEVHPIDLDLVSLFILPLAIVRLLIVSCTFVGHVFPLRGARSSLFD
jgi:hypothetical protein